MKTKYWGIYDWRPVRRVVHHCRRLFHALLLLMARYLISLLRGSKERLTRADREEIADEIESLLLRLDLEKQLRDEKPRTKDHGS